MSDSNFYDTGEAFGDISGKYAQLSNNAFTNAVTFGNISGSYAHLSHNIFKNINGTFGEFSGNRIHLDHCDFDDQGGVLTVSGLEFFMSDCEMSDLTTTGLDLNAGYSQIHNNMFNSNSADPTIDIQTSSTVIVHGNDINSHSGIAIGGTCGFKSSIKNNVLRGTGAKLESTLSGAISGNLGHTTENSGTATLLSATTSIAVSHGLAVTPSAGDIVVTPSGTLGSANSFWIDTYTSSSFTINTNVAPGTNVGFVWKATVL